MLELTPQDKSLEIRQSAGLLLKNNLRSSWAKLTPDVQHYVKVSVRQRHSSPGPNSCSHLAVAMCRRACSTAWPCRKGRSASLPARP